MGQLLTIDVLRSTEVENAFLLAQSELLTSTLLPFETSPHLFDSPAADVVTAHVENLLRGYVLDSRWTRSPDLIAQSLRVLAMLTLAPLDSPVREDHLTKLFSALKVGNPGSDEIEDTEKGVDSVQRALVGAYLRGDALLRQADRVLDTMLGAARTTVGVPASARLDAVSVAEHIVHMLRADCGRAKLKSFVFYEKQQQSGTTVDSEGLVRTLAGKLAAQRGVAHLLAGLNDSDDAVRNSCVQAVAAAVPLLLSDAEAAQLASDERLLPRVCALAQMPASAAVGATGYKAVVLSVEQVTRTLLRQVLTPGAGESAEFLAYLNDTLRLVCVLDPRAFEATVRAELAPALLGSVETSAVGDGEVRKGLVGEQISEFVSGLLNHVDVLLQFS